MATQTPPVVRVDDSQLQVVLLNMSKTGRQTMAVALNRTRDDAIAPQRAKIKQVFTIRAGRERFLVPPASAPAAFKATETRLYTPISLAYDDGKRSVGYHAKRILEKHGATQEVPSTDRFLPFFRPTPSLRPNVSALVPQRLYPRNLLGQFNSRGEITGIGRKAKVTKQTRRVIKRRGLAAVVEGAGLLPKQYRTRERIVGRYFILGQPGDPMHGIYERTGPSGPKGSDNIRMIWDFMQTQRLRKRLDFEPEVRQVIAERWAVNYTGAFDKAMSTGLSGFGAGKRSR